MHRLDLGLYSHSKEVFVFFWGGGGVGEGGRGWGGVRTHVNSKRKKIFHRDSEEGRTRDALSCRTAGPTHYLLSSSGPGPKIAPRSSHTSDIKTGTAMQPWRTPGVVGAVLGLVGLTSACCDCVK